MTRRFWMSFVNDSGPNKSDTFAGACIVEVTDTDADEALGILKADFPNHMDGAEWLAAATRKAWRLGINPGGQVASWDITDVPVPEDVDMILDTLMDRAELERRGFQPVSESDEA